MPGDGHRRPIWLLARRGLQLALLLAFAGAPWGAARWVEGTLASSRWFGALPLTDPLVLLQALMAGAAASAAGTLGAVLVVVPVVVIGGRVFCGWVCPVNLLADAADALRRRIGWRGSLLPRPDRRLRLVMLVGVLLASAASGRIVWEWLNPITAISQSLALGWWTGGVVAVAAVLAIDLLLWRRGWCGTLCPVGALHALLGRWGRVRMAAPRADICTRCGDCFEVCPEPQVITPVLDLKSGAVRIADGDCLRCGRCLEVCPERVFAWSLR